MATVPWEENPRTEHPSRPPDSGAPGHGPVASSPTRCALPLPSADSLLPVPQLLSEPAALCLVASPRRRKVREQLWEDACRCSAAQIKAGDSELESWEACGSPGRDSYLELMGQDYVAHVICPQLELVLPSLNFRFKLQQQLLEQGSQE